MDLAGADEVHLAPKTGPVAGEAKVVVKGRHRGRELGRIVERADPGREPPAQHRGPRRRTEREVAAGVLEHDAFLGEAVDMRGAHPRVAVRVFYGLYKDMFRRGIQGRITHALVFDEAHRAARLKLIPTMAKECRKYGISLVLASQEARDFDTSVFSAIANYLVLRSTDTDAKFLVRNVSNSRQEHALIDRIKQMDRFKALYFAEGKSRPSQVALSP